ncbi:hypothetical protein DRP98_06960 [candidate division KSB1 bacterium]|nr:MAG: hypothetical protein DRP98_06960 [candidate division KSB1 bacterium]
MRWRLLVKRILLVGLSLIFLSYQHCAQKADNIVARVGTEIITLEEFERDFGDSKLVSRLKASPMQARESHLEKMILKKLMALAARADSLDQDDIVQKELTEEKEKQLYLTAIQVDIYDKLVSEQEVKEYYQHLNEKRHVAQIFLKFNYLNNPKEVERVRKKAQRLLDKIKKGADFAELAKKYSQDKRTAPNGGDMGYIRWGTDRLSKHLQQIIFNLKPGEVSQPVETQIGFHIFKVTEEKIYYKPSYSEARFRIQRILIDTQKRKEFEKIFASYYDSLKQVYGVKFNEENIYRFAEKMAASKEQHSKPDSLNRGRFYLITEEDKKLPLVTFEGGSITLGEFIPTITAKYPPYNLPVQEYVEGTKERLKDMLRIKLLAYHAYQRGLQNSPPIQRKLKRLKEDLLAKAFQGKKIFAEASKQGTNFIESKKIANQLMKEWIKKLHERYKVKIYYRVLKKAYSRL